MNKKYSIVTNLRVIKKNVTIGAGIMITLFSCIGQVKVSDTFIKSERSFEMIQETLPVICADLEISLAQNVETVVSESKKVTTKGESGNVIDTFVSSILKNTKSIDEDFSKVVDENFWNLI